MPKSADQRRLAPVAPGEMLTGLLLLRFAAGDQRIIEGAHRSGRPGSADREGNSLDFEPVAGARAIVEEFAARFSLRLSWPGECGGLIARLEGSTENFNTAFRVELHDYYAPAGDFRGYEGAISLPRELAAVVRSVFGLAGRPAPSIFTQQDLFRELPPAEMPAPLDANTVLDVAKGYSFPAGAGQGRGQRVGILSSSGRIRMSDLSTYLGEAGILRVPEIRLAARRRGDERPAPFDTAALLALEILTPLAPEAEYVLLGLDEYAIGDWQACFLLALLGAICGSQPVDVLVVPLGAPEHYWTRDEIESLSLLLAMAACLGISVCAASGDYGAAGFDPSSSSLPANVHFPAASPYVLSCGATRLHFEAGRAREISSEEVWNDLDRPEQPRASGGGMSACFPAPAYQIDCRAEADRPLEGRGVPDVAANAAPASGYRLYADGVWIENAAGTALAAALWAGLVVRLNDELKTRLGWINPLLYDLRLARGREICRRVYAAEGTNCNGPLSRRFAAKYCASDDQDFNLCAGLGVPDGEALLEALREEIDAARAETQ